MVKRERRPLGKRRRRFSTFDENGLRRNSILRGFHVQARKVSK